MMDALSTVPDGGGKCPTREEVNVLPGKGKCPRAVVNVQSGKCPGVILQG